MSDPTKDPSGANDPASGGDPNKDQTVSYETHRKLLGEKKNTEERNRKLQEELDALKAKEADAAKKKLEEEGKWKELAEAKDKELEAERKKNSEIIENLNTARKKTALLRAISGDVPEGAHALLPLDMIQMGEDGKPDPATVKAAAQHFETTHSYAVLRDKKGSGLPNDAGKGTKGKLTVAEYEALSPSEMKARFHEVDWSTAKK